MRKFVTTLAVTGVMAFGSLGFATQTAQANDDTITDFVAKSGGEFDGNPFDYDILLNAVLTAELAEALADPNADYTLFAPNDRAFIRLARDLGYEGWDEEETWLFLVDALTELGGGDPIPVLTDILLYHVGGESLDFIDVLMFNVYLSNGIVHTINRVLIPLELPGG